MRIVHTCLRYPPALGGAERYIAGLVEHTRDVASGRDVRVLTSALKTHHPPTALDPALLVDDPPYVQRLAYARTPALAYPRLQALPYYLGHHDPDIVEAYAFWYQPADVAARFARRRHRPFVFHPLFYLNARRQRPVWRLYAATIGRSTFAAADVVVTISPQEQALISAQGFPVRRFALIPPGLDLTSYEHRQPNPYAARGINGRILLAVGRLSSGKSLDELLEAAAQLRPRYADIHVVLVGEDFGAHADLATLASRLGMSQRVHFLGRVSPRELIGCYQHAHVLVHPSHYEAFGIAPLEALACGLPVIARHTAAIPYVLDGGKAGWLFRTPGELMTTINTVLSNPAAAAERVSAGRKRSHNFTLAASVSKLIALYQELLP